MPNLKLKLGIIHLGIILLVLIGLTTATSISLFAKNRGGRPLDLSFITGSKLSPCGYYGHEGKLGRRDIRELNSGLARQDQLNRKEDVKKWDVDSDGQVPQADADLIIQFLNSEIQTFPACGEATLPQAGKRATCDFFSQRHGFKSTRLGGSAIVTDKDAQAILARPQDWTKKVGPLFTTSKWGLQINEGNDEGGSSRDVNADGNATDAELIRQYLAYQFFSFPACPPPPPATDLVWPRKNDPNAHYYDNPTQRCWPYGYTFGGIDAGEAQFLKAFKDGPNASNALPQRYQSPFLDIDADGVVTGLDFRAIKVPPWPICAKDKYHPENILGPRAYAPKDCDERGDINGDGRVTYDDVKTVFAAIREETTISAERHQKADTDGDGKITILDAVYIYMGPRGASNLFAAPARWPTCGMPDLITPAPASSALFKLPPCRQLGDVNRDGQIDDYDAQHIFQYVSGFTSAPQTGPNYEDVSKINGDNVVGVTDGRLIRQYLAGTIDTFPDCANSGLAPGNPNRPN